MRVATSHGVGLWMIRVLNADLFSADNETLGFLFPSSFQAPSSRPTGSSSTPSHHIVLDYNSTSAVNMSRTTESVLVVCDFVNLLPKFSRGSHEHKSSDMYRYPRPMEISYFNLPLKSLTSIYFRRTMSLFFLSSFQSADFWIYYYPRWSWNWMTSI